MSARVQSGESAYLLQVSFCKRATNYRVPFWKMTCKDMASCGSSPSCMYCCVCLEKSCFYVCVSVCLSVVCVSIAVSILKGVAFICVCVCVCVCLKGLLVCFCLCVYVCLLEGCWYVCVCVCVFV